MANVTMLGVGDLILDVDDLEPCFAKCKDLLTDADITIGNVETPHTDRPFWCSIEPHSSPCSPLKNLSVLRKVGFDVGTVGGNHVFDQGPYAILDTLEYLHNDGIATCGSGKDDVEARKPALLERKGIKFAFLHYNLTGPAMGYAHILKPGCAYVRIATAYVCDRSEPGASPTCIYTVADPRKRQDMIDDIEEAQKVADNVIVYFHSGTPNHPPLMQYEYELAHHCIDVGVQMVLCAHTHAFATIEIYKHKPVFYGLGNFVVATHSTDANSPTAQLRHSNPYLWPGIQPVWESEPFKSIRPKAVKDYPFSEASRNTLIAKGIFDENGLVSAGFIPCWINDEGQPEPVQRGGKGDEVIAYMQDWIEKSAVDTKLEWNAEGTEIVFDLGK